MKAKSIFKAVTLVLYIITLAALLVSQSDSYSIKQTVLLGVMAIILGQTFYSIKL